MSNRSTGLNALQKFYNYQRMYHGTKVTYSFDDLLSFYGKKKEIYLEGVGDMIVNGNVTNMRLEAALVQLAKDSQGKILQNPIKISNYIQNQATKIDWLDAASFVVTESVKDVAKGAQAVGDSLITSMKIVNFLLPVIVLGALFFFLDGKSGGKLSGAIKGFKK